MKALRFCTRCRLANEHSIETHVTGGQWFLLVVLLLAFVVPGLIYLAVLGIFGGQATALGVRAVRCATRLGANELPRRGRRRGGRQVTKRGIVTTAPSLLAAARGNGTGSRPIPRWRDPC